MSKRERLLRIAIAFLAMYAVMLACCLGPIEDYRVRDVGVVTVEGEPKKAKMLKEMNRCIDAIAVETARQYDDVYAMESALTYVKWTDEPIPANWTKFGWANGTYGGGIITVMHTPKLSETSYCHEMGHHARWYWGMPFDPEHKDYAWWRDVR